MLLMTTVMQDNTQTRPSRSLDDATLKRMLGQMMLIRRFEERTAQSYQQAKIGGFCHLYIGQEATAVGSISALRPDDPIITAYRDHGHALARGMDPRFAMAEMFGKVTGCCKGKGGSMHYFDRPHHMYGGHAIVGGQCPLGVGLAFAIQYNSEDKICVCYLGDGALNQGAFHESMNLAAIWNLPIIFVVENNGYSMGTHISRGTAMAHDLSTKAAAYGMKFARCNGMDVLDTYDCFKTLADAMRRDDAEGGSSVPNSENTDDGAQPVSHPDDDQDRPESGRNQPPGQPAEASPVAPVLVDCQTYRYKGHSMSDPQKYRTKDEVSQYEQQDPINDLVNYLIDHDMATQQEVDELDGQAKRRAIDAVRYANESPDVGVEEMYTDVYSQPFVPFKKGQLPLMLQEDKP